NRHPWIQAGIRILENHLDLMGITLEVRRLVAFRKLLAFENHFTRGFVMQPYQGFSECRFPRTALSDETDDLLRVHIQTHTVHGVYDPFRVEPEVFGDALCFNERLHTVSPRNSSGTSC